MIQYTFSYVKFHEESKNVIKNANFWRETPVFLKDFDVTNIFLILNIISYGDHVPWEFTVLSQWKVIKFMF